MKIIFTLMLILLILIGCNSGSGSGTNNFIYEPYIPPQEPIYENVKYFGYYWGNSYYYGNYLSEFVDHTNLSWAEVDSNLDEAIFYDQKIVVTLCNRIEDDGLFNQASNALNWYVENNYIFAFYIFDEPYLNGVSFERQQAAIEKIRNRFPKVEVWTTFAYSSIYTGFKVADYDRVSITPAYGDFNANDMQSYIDILKENLQPWQKIFLTADGFNFNEIPSEYIQYQKSDIAEDYYDLAACNDIEIILVFLWPTTIPSYQGGAGIQDMAILKQTFKEIGNDIIKH